MLLEHSPVSVGGFDIVIISTVRRKELNFAKGFSVTLSTSVVFKNTYKDVRMQRQSSKS